MNAFELAASRHDATDVIDPPALATARRGSAMRAGRRWPVILFAMLAAAAIGVAVEESKGPQPVAVVPASDAIRKPSELPAATSVAVPSDAIDGAKLVQPWQLLARDARQSSADESGLLEVYGLLANGHADEALARARRLATERPAFGLGQLAYADLLNVQARHGRVALGADPTEFSGPARERLADLTAEARARIQGAVFAPPPGTVPEPFVVLDPQVRHAIAVDVSRSRVYVIENDAQGPRLLRQYYASIGKLGTLKQTEGDQRTPLGVYFVTREVPTAHRDERYGSRALVLNYPNPYDRLEGRSGDSIWLHGVPANLYTRAPRATDGCVALPNPQMEELAQFIAPQGTPVVVAEHLDWALPGTLRARQGDFMAVFERWRVARDAAQPEALHAFYSTALNVPEVPSMGAPWRASLEEEQRHHTNAEPPRPISGLSVVRWKDQRELMIVTFAEKAETSTDPSRTRRQYWMKEDGGWRIFYERLLG